MPELSKHHHRQSKAETSLDVQVLQTAASLENLAVASYASAARLTVVRAGGALGAFVTRTRVQHAAHADAFNAAVVKAGGRVERAPDPRYAVTVHQALENPGDAASVASLLESLEDVNAQSYIRYASLASPSNPGLRRLFVSVATVEAAHRSFLLAALKLLSAGEVALLMAPANPQGLPGALGADCFPDAFYPTVQASAIGEGSVR